MPTDRNKTFFKHQHGVHTTLILRLSLVCCLYALSRVAFFVYNRSVLPPASAATLARMMWGGLRFDISATLYTNAPTIALMLLPFRARHSRWFRRTTDALFVGSNALCLLLNSADFIRFRYTSQRATAGIFHEYQHLTNPLGLALHFAWEHKAVTLFALTLVALLPLACRYVAISPVTPTTPFWRYFLLHTVVAAAGILFFVVGCRGAFFARSNRPINNLSAGRYVSRPEHMAVVLNTPFSLVRTIDKTFLERLHAYPSEATLAAIYTPVHQPAPAPGPGRGKNIVLVILESFGAEHIGRLNRHLDGGQYRGYTPFLDSLIERSLLFPNAFANGRKSIDALPSLLASIPAIGQSFVVSPYSHNRFLGLPAALGHAGYDTAFFHGAARGSMGFLSFAHLAGFTRYDGMEDYGHPSDYDGNWGIYDEPFFQYVAEQLQTLHQPFFATVFSLSSHSPYTLPQHHQGKFPRGPRPLQELIGYTDFSLKRFFAAAESAPWYRNTLFVITADHGASAYRDEYKNHVGVFRVPLLFFAPGDDTFGGRVDERVAQHIDVAPSLLRYIGYDRSYVGFGRDNLLCAGSEQEEPFAAMQRSGVSQLIFGPYALHTAAHQRGRSDRGTPGPTVLGLFSYNEDRLLKADLQAALPQVRDRLKTFQQAFLQQYHNRMLDDKLTPSPAEDRLLGAIENNK